MWPRALIYKPAHLSLVEMLSQTQIVEYHDPADRLDALRAAVKARGIKPIAREAQLDERHVRRFVNQTRDPHVSTVARIEAALRGLSGQ